MSEIGTCRCGARFRGQQNHCTLCHRTFSTETVGDRHRVGTYDPPARRCVSDEEMVKKGFERLDRALGPVWGYPRPTLGDLEEAARLPWVV